MCNLLLTFFFFDVISAMHVFRKIASRKVDKNWKPAINHWSIWEERNCRPSVGGQTICTRASFKKYEKSTAWLSPSNIVLSIINEHCNNDANNVNDCDVEDRTILLRAIRTLHLPSIKSVVNNLKNGDVIEILGCVADSTDFSANSGDLGDSGLVVTPMPYVPHEIFNTVLPCTGLLIGALVLRHENCSIENVVNTPLPIPVLLPSRWVTLYDVLPDNEVSMNVVVCCVLCCCLSLLCVCVCVNERDVIAFTLCIVKTPSY